MPTSQIAIAALPVQSQYLNALSHQRFGQDKSQIGFTATTASRHQNMFLEPVTFKRKRVHLLTAISHLAQLKITTGGKFFVRWRKRRTVRLKVITEMFSGQ